MFGACTEVRLRHSYVQTYGVCIGLMGKLPRDHGGVTKVDSWWCHVLAYRMSMIRAMNRDVPD